MHLQRLSLRRLLAGVLHCHYFVTTAAEPPHGARFRLPVRVRIAQSRLNIGMPEKLLHRHQVGAVAVEPGRERVAESVPGHVLKPCLLAGLFQPQPQVLPPVPPSPGLERPRTS